MPNLNVSKDSALFRWAENSKENCETRKFYLQNNLLILCNSKKY